VLLADFWATGSPKAFEQVLDAVANGFLHTGVPRWQAVFPSPLKLVSKVKASPLNLHYLARGGGGGGGGGTKFAPQK
jgi:hypothetical protein